MHSQSLITVLLGGALLASAAQAQTWEQLVAQRWPGDSIRKVTEAEFERLMSEHVAVLGEKDRAVRAFLVAQHRAYGHPATGDLWFVNAARPTVLPENVTDYEQLEGPEPNGDPAQGGRPSSIGCGSQGRGAIDAPGIDIDQDWWTFWLAAPTQVTLYTSRGTAGASGYVADTILELYDYHGNLVASDDDGGAGLYSLIVRTLPAGTYHANVRPFSVTTTVGSYVLDLVCEPPQQGPQQIQEGAEPNHDPNAQGTPTPALVPSDCLGDINPSGDSDWWSFTVPGPMTIRGATAAGVGGSAVGDSTLTLRDSSGTQLAFDDDGGPGLYSQVDFALPVAGTYYFDVQAFGTRTGDYTLSISEPGVVVVATYTTDMTGCPGSNGTPTIAAPFGETPRIGSVFALEVTGLPTPGNGFAVGNLGFTQQIGSLTLPVDLAFLASPGCLLSCDIAVRTALPSTTTGETRWYLGVPLDAALLDLNFYQQVIVRDTSGLATPITTSNLGTGKIGNAID